MAAPLRLAYGSRMTHPVRCLVVAFLLAVQTLFAGRALGAEAALRLAVEAKPAAGSCSRATMHAIGG